MEGIKRKRRCQIQCQEHIFCIQSLKANSSKYDIKLLFCPKFQRQPLPPEHTYPEYNNDSKFYTSAFILGVDKRVLIKNQQQELMDHQKQMRDSLEKHNQLIFPRPNSKHSLCSVCKENYKNYYYHISSEEHRQRISLSLYNNHIKELCYRYLDLWEGAQERADEEAQRRVAQQQERRQLFAEMTIQENDQQEEESLLDVQRGDNDYQNEGEQDDPSRTQNIKANKRYNKNVFKEDDTIPFTARTNKRNAPQGRSYTSEYLRKKFLSNNYTSVSRSYRERQERRYQRQRDKIKTERDFETKKQFFKVNQKQGDIFIIMKASFAAHPQNIDIKPPEVQKVSENLNLAEQPIQTKRLGEFVWKRTTDKFIKQQQKLSIKGQKSQRYEQTPQKYQKQNRKYEIDYGKEQKYINRYEQFDKYDSRPYYPYPSLIPPYVIPQYGPQHIKNSQSKSAQPYKQQYLTKRDHEDKSFEKNDYKNMHPYCYNPYIYPPPIYEPYLRGEKMFDSGQKDKTKSVQRLYDYPMQYPWHYPYYAPPPPPHVPQLDLHSAPAKSPSSTGSTSMNSYPSHMYPLPPPMQATYPPRYQAPPVIPSPYMGYQHHPSEAREGDYSANVASNINQPGSSSKHLQGISKGLSQHLHQPYHQYPPYPHHNGYPAHYQYPPQSQHQTVSSK